MSLLRNRLLFWRTVRWLAVVGAVCGCSMNPRPEEEPDSVGLAGPNASPGAGGTGSLGNGDDVASEGDDQNEAPRDQADPGSTADPPANPSDRPEAQAPGDAGPPEDLDLDAGAFGPELLGDGGTD